MRESLITLETVILLLFRIGIVTLIALVVLVIVVFTGPIGIGATVVVALMIWRAARLTRQRAFVLMLAEAIQRRIPLIPALEAFREEYAESRLAVAILRPSPLVRFLFPTIEWRWNWRGSVDHFARALSDGIALPEALRLLPGLVPLESLPLIDAGHRAGRLSEALRRIAVQNDRTGPVWQSVVGKVFYLALLVMIIFGIWVFMAIKIMPVYKKIFSDFDAALPPITELMMSVSSAMCIYWPLDVLIGLLLLGLFLYGSACYVGLTMCDLRGTRWLVRRLDTATVLDTLALTTEARQPMPAALAALTAHYPKPSIRRRLRRAWRAVASGRQWCDGLAAVGLLRPAEVGLLQSAARVGNLPWAMREMADSNRRRFAYRLNAILQVLFPLTLGLVGLVVCLYVTACFLPLVKLIEVLV